MKRKSFRERVAYIFLEADPVHVAGLSGTAALLWGLQLLRPPRTFATSLSFDIMAAVAPEWLWGGVLALFGFLQVLSTLTGNARLNFVVSAITCGLWGFIALVFTIANPIGTATAVYPVLTFASFIATYQRYATWKGQRHVKAPPDAKR